MGKQKILAIDAGFDAQGTYHSESANIAFDQPVLNGDEVGGQFQFFHYDGGDRFTAIHDQNDWFVETAFYAHRIKLQVFGKIEAQNFVALAADTSNINRVGGGMNYYIHGQNLKWTMQCMRTLPKDGSTLRSSNEVTLQLQVFYF